MRRHPKQPSLGSVASILGEGGEEMGQPQRKHILHTEWEGSDLGVPGGGNQRRKLESGDPLNLPFGCSSQGLDLRVPKL